MVEVDVHFAAHLEHAHTFLMAAAIEAIARRRGKGADVLCLPVLGGMASYAGPGSPHNKVIGIGIDEVGQLEVIAGVEKAFEDRGEPVQAEICTLAQPGILEGLARRGYILQGFEHVLGRRLGEGETLGEVEGVEVRQAEETELSDCIEAMVTGFEHPDEGGMPDHQTFPRELLLRTLEEQSGATGMSHWVALRDGEVAGSASLWISPKSRSRVGLLCGAATRPDHRRKGVQTALLQARLAACVEAGCKLVSLTAGPGTKSHHNAQRRGFELLYARAIMVRPTTSS